MEKIRIDVYQISSEDTMLIIGAPTGVIYNAQTGGMSCNHPEYEGFVLPLGSFMEDFDDCSYGCSHLQDIEGAAKKLANDLHLRLIEETKLWRYKIYFDFDRIDQLQEGWWPVIVSGKIFEDGKDYTMKGFVHTGNCD